MDIKSRCSICLDYDKSDRGLLFFRRKIKNSKKLYNKEDILISVCSCQSKFYHKNCILKKIICENSVKCNICNQYYMIELNSNSNFFYKLYYFNLLSLFFLVIIDIICIVVLILNINYTYSNIYYFWKIIVYIVISLILVLSIYNKIKLILKTRDKTYINSIRFSSKSSYNTKNILKNILDNYNNDNNLISNNDYNENNVLNIQNSLSNLNNSSSISKSKTKLIVKNSHERKMIIKNKTKIFALLKTDFDLTLPEIIQLNIYNNILKNLFGKRNYSCVEQASLNMTYINRTLKKNPKSTTYDMHQYIDKDISYNNLNNESYVQSNNRISNINNTNNLINSKIKNNNDSSVILQDQYCCNQNINNQSKLLNIKSNLKSPVNNYNKKESIKSNIEKKPVHFLNENINININRNETKLKTNFIQRSSISNLNNKKNSNLNSKVDSSLLNINNVNLLPKTDDKLNISGKNNFKKDSTNITGYNINNNITAAEISAINDRRKTTAIGNNILDKIDNVDSDFDDNNVSNFNRRNFVLDISEEDNSFDIDKNNYDESAIIYKSEANIL